MKVVFDEHVPTALAKVFIALSNEKVIQKTCGGFTFERASDYAPTSLDKDYVRKSDVPWLDRYAAANGHAVISGDKKMRQKPHERLALYQHGFVVIFFEASWADWDFYQKSSLMLRWWPHITTKIKTAAKGTFWVVPSAWPGRSEGELRNVSFGLAQLLKDNPDRKAKIKAKLVHPRRARPRDASESRQSNFEPLLESAQDD